MSVLPLTADAQFDLRAPEPQAPLGGALILGGGDELPASVYERFFELSRRHDREAVVIATRDAGARKRWRARDANLMHFVVDPSDLPGTLPSSGGLWIEDDLIGAFVASAEALAAMHKHVDGGGVLGASGAAAEKLAAARLASSASSKLAKGPGVLPGSILLTAYRDKKDRARLAEALKGRRELIGFGIAPKTALELDGRYFRARGDGEVTAILAPSATRPLRVDRVQGRRPGDLISLRRAARARRGPVFPTDPAPVPKVEKGALIIAGGGRLSAAIIARFIELAGGVDAPIVFIPCSSAKEIRRSPGMVGLLKRHGAKRVSWFHTKDRKLADEGEDILGPLREAKGLWFGGGRQWNFVDSYQHTAAHALMHAVLARGGVIGGSSAGASIQADYMCRGDPLGNLNIIAEGYETGLGFLRGVGIDQHFSQRRRQPDMAHLMRTFPSLLGIGLDEGTAIEVRQHEATVLGPKEAGKVHFYDARSDRNRPAVSSVSTGNRYDLKTRSPIVD